MNFSSYVINLHGIYTFDSCRFIKRNSPLGTSDFVVIGFNKRISSRDNIVAIIREIII